MTNQVGFLGAADFDVGAADQPERLVAGAFFL